MSFQAIGPAHCTTCHEDYSEDAIRHKCFPNFRHTDCTVKCGKWYESDFDRFMRENPHCEECRKALEQDYKDKFKR